MVLKHEYFVNLRKMAKYFNKHFLLYCNIMLSWPVMTCSFQHPPHPRIRGCLIYFTLPHQRVHYFFHIPLFVRPPTSGNNDPLPLNITRCFISLRELSIKWLTLGEHHPWWMDVRYNFVYILLTISGATFHSGESNLMSVLGKCSRI